ncbi:MAG: glutamate:protein symporter [Phycisphaerales bacterium]|nr:glutamate:protein symporter [Phycisphaerales bacterium]
MAVPLDYSSAPPAVTSIPPKKPIYKNLTFQVLTAITIGALIGVFSPRVGVALGPLGDGFIRLVKMVVTPIIFLTVVVGIASMGNLKKAGRVGLKAIGYFEIVTTIALAIGLLVANVARPGSGIDRNAVKVTQETTQQVAKYQAAGEQQKDFAQVVLHIIPNNVFAAFAGEDILPVLFFAVLFGVAVAGLGERGRPIVAGMERLTEAMFRVVSIIMRVAPLGALGAIAFTVGKFGAGALVSLLKLMGCVYLTMGIFIFVVLGSICWMCGFSLWRYLVFIREEILLVLGTSSSESALPRMMEKMEVIGCGRDVVRMVIPAGYSFNLDGTSIYLSMAMLFIAQAFGINMSLGQQLYVLAILMLTSKGAAAVTGGGFITLAATISATKTGLPVEGLALLIGVDRFMSEARAITNLIGNGVAAIVVSKWEGDFDQTKYLAAISGRPEATLAGVGLPVEVGADLGRSR